MRSDSEGHGEKDRRGRLGDTAERVVPGEIEQSILENHVQRYLFASGYVRDKSCLDVACGSGFGSAILRERGGAGSVKGVDISSDAIEYATEHYGLEGISFLTGDARRLDFDDGTFDVVVSFETIEHVEDHEKIVREIKRVLRKEGTFIVSTPNKRYDCKNPYHLVRFSPEDFRRVLLSEFGTVEMYGQHLLEGRMERLMAILNRIAGYVLPSSLMNRLWRAKIDLSPEAPEGKEDVRSGVELRDCRYMIAVCRNRNEDSSRGC